MKSLAACVCLALATRLAAEDYDPLKVADTAIVSKTFDVKDAKRDRTLPVRVYLPETGQAAPVVLFSHGLGGSRDNNPYLGNHWARRGYAVVFVQHPGSDESVWKNVPPAERMAAMNKAADLGNFIRRGEDIPAVLDALESWNASADHPLHGRLDLKRVGMSGHSFGAVTTQAVAGQSFAGGKLSFREPRVSAAVMMSPSIPRLGDPATAFGSIRIPCLLMTGTLDESRIGGARAADRVRVFPNITAAPAWQVVFDKATHMSFSQRDSDSGNRYRKPILALTTAFWDAELQGDAAAKAWLNGEGARSVLEREDKWEINGQAKEKP